jgi:hypothetical protein
MFTLNNILQEIKEVPSDRLEEVYEFVHSLNTKTKYTVKSRKKILSFAGAFSEMSDKDYADFKKETKKSRKILFERKTNI